jgi:hypothetical protein
VVFYATAGETYHFEVDGQRFWPYTDPGAAGHIQLRLDPAQGPPNDDFANRIDLSSAALPMTVHGTLESASREPGEDAAAGQVGGTINSVWYRWMAPSNGVLRLKTASGGGSDPYVAVFRGDTLTELRLVAYNGAPEVSLRAAAGVTYSILLDVRSWQLPGEFDLTLEPRLPPPNDDRAQAAVIPPAGGTVTGSNRNATHEEGEYDHGWNSVWWVWQAPADGTAELSSAGSSFTRGLVMIIYADEPDLPWIGSSNGRDTSYCQDSWPCYQDLATFKAQAGRRYYAAVLTFDEQPEIKLTLRLLAPPPNDDYAQPASLAGLQASGRGSNLGATRERDEWDAVGGGGQGGQSVWWVWTAPVSGRVSLDFTATPMPVQVGVFTSERFDPGSRIADNRVTPAAAVFTNRMTFSANAGVTYHLGVDGIGAVGELAFELRLVPALLLEAQRAGANRLELRLTGASTRPFVLEASTDLRRWTPLTTNSLVNETFRFADPDFGRQSRRFYRAIEAP